MGWGDGITYVRAFQTGLCGLSFLSPQTITQVYVTAVIHSGQGLHRGSASQVRSFPGFYLTWYHITTGRVLVESVVKAVVERDDDQLD